MNPAGARIIRWTVYLHWYLSKHRIKEVWNFGSLEERTDRLLAFQARYAAIARPFEWTFTRTDLERVIARIDRQGRGRFALAARRLRDESQTGRG